MKDMTNKLSILLALTLTSCAVGPDYIAPDLAVDGAFSEAGQDQALDIEQQWWKSFNDQTLNSLIADAVANNKGVQQSLSRINQSRALARQAFAELLPGTQLSGGMEKSKTSGARFPGADNGADGTEEKFEYKVFTAGIDAAWEIDFFGRLRRELEARNAAYDGSVATLHDSVRILIAEVALSYFQLRASQAELAVAQKNLTIQEETNEFVQTKRKFGTANELDTARAEAQLESTRSIVPTLELMVKMQKNRLAVLLGKKPGELKDQLAEVKEIPSYGGPLTVGTPEMLLRRRPDLRAAERELASQTALVGVAVGELFPKIQISGSVGLEANTFNNIPDGAETYHFGPSFTWSPFDLGRLRSKIKAQDAKTEEALLGYEQAVLEALEDVENAIASLNAENRRLVSTEKAYKASSRAHQLAVEQYEEGVIDFLSVLDAQEEALNNERLFIQSKQQAATALVGLYKALGGGWEEWKLVDGE